MRLLVTGGSGFLGRRVLPLAVEQGHEVLALTRSVRSLDVVTSLGATPVPGDLDDPRSLDAAFGVSGADSLLNLASLGFGHAPAIVAAATEAGIERAVFVSTTAVTTLLDAGSKKVRLAAEETVRASGLRWTIIRPTMIYGGPDDRNIARLVRVLRRTRVLPLPGGGAALQQPVHVEDLAAALLAAVGTDVAVARTYDVAGPEPMTFRRLVETAADAVGRRVWLVPVPLRPVVGAARAYERLARTPRLKSEQLARLAEDKAFAIDDAVRDLGFNPRSFAAGVRAMAR